MDVIFFVIECFINQSVSRIMHQFHTEPAKMKTLFPLLAALLCAVRAEKPPGPESILGPDFQVHIVGTDNEGNHHVRRWTPDKSTSDGASSNKNLVSHPHYPNYNRDTIISQMREFNKSKISTRATTGGPAIIEVVIIVDKDFGDIFNHDYYRIVDYLTIYFWDINMRFKTLRSVDLSIKVNGLIIMDSPQAQPFIEKARGSDRRVTLGWILHHYKFWVYEQRGWLPKHDVAPLMTAAEMQSGEGSGLAHAGAACVEDDNKKVDWGTLVWSDYGDFGRITVGAHELAHTIGAPHDDDDEKCRGFIMNGAYLANQYRFFFSDCSDRKITAFVNSDAGQCLKRIDGYATAPFDPNFSSAKAPSMNELCKKALNDPSAWIEPEDSFDCQQMRCKRKSANSIAVVTHFLGVVENSICGSGSGRCFRGRCRAEGKLIKNQGDGNCIQTPDRFDHMVIAKMGKCPSSKDRTPLNTIEIRDGPGRGDKRLATPFTKDGNKESGDRCLYTGNAEGDAIWTDRCSNDNPWHGWEFWGVGGDNFLLLHTVTGRCARSMGEGAAIQTFWCNAGNPNMIWTVTNGN